MIRWRIIPPGIFYRTCGTAKAIPFQSDDQGDARDFAAQIGGVAVAILSLRDHDGKGHGFSRAVQRVLSCCGGTIRWRIIPPGIFCLTYGTAKAIPYQSANKRGPSAARGADWRRGARDILFA